MSIDRSQNQIIILVTKLPEVLEHQLEGCSTSHVMAYDPKQIKLKTFKNFTRGKRRPYSPSGKSGR